ncbi:hypothetical protein Glove_216g99 [Diversispora epigaea]|uniref:Uncharacterized protein n=1 Tax=Diversispora epigaea TaxID=1348612 RepID=A0A397IHN3_9GLOM|nr:hypothetical protein Glove_216g99 [Diversispora epigaea]
MCNDVLKDIWNNSAFSFEFAKTLSKGTYQSTIILPTIRASLKNLPISDSFFISTSKKQSVTSANRKGNGFIGKHPDIMFVAKYRETIFELIKYNDGFFWVCQTLKLDKNQFDVVGIQIAVQFSDGRVVYKFIETLLLLHNLIIINLSLLYHGTITSSQRLKEGSTTVTTPRDDYP